MQNDLDPKGFEAALGCYSEGGCSGLDERERREVVTDIIEAYLSAVPNGEGNALAWLHRPTGNVFKDGECQKLIEIWQRQFKDIPADEISADFIPLYAASLSQARVRVTDEMVERFAAELWKLDDAYARSIPHSKIRSALEAALPGDTL